MSSHLKRRVPGRRDLMGWSAFVSALAPWGINAEEVGIALSDEASARFRQLGPVVAGEVRDGRTHLSVAFNFTAHHQDAEIEALRTAAPAFAALGMAIDRVELTACEP